MPVNLQALLEQGNDLPPAFSAQRREALLIAWARVRYGSTTPIPELPACPGFYTPPVPRARLISTPRVERAPISHLEANRQWRERKRAKQGIGYISVGVQVPAARGMATVLGFVAPGDNPMVYVPAGTPIGRVSGSRAHDPCHVARYAVAVEIDGRIHYLFPKAVALDREYKAAVRLAS